MIYRDNFVYLVFEYLSGGDLFDGILARNWYSERQSCLLAKQILEALEHCHKLKVIHRVRMCYWTKYPTAFVAFVVCNCSLLRSFLQSIFYSSLQDLKPENLLICQPCQKGEVPHLKLTDFGIACEIPGKSFLLNVFAS